MNKINVYLGKSNRANPTTVSRVRTYLRNNSLINKVKEYEGGEYSHKDMLSCDYVVFVLTPGTNIIGKGLFQQIEECYANDIKLSIIYTSETSGNIWILEEIKIKLIESSFVEYARLIWEANENHSYKSLDNALVSRINTEIINKNYEIEKKLKSISVPHSEQPKEVSTIGNKYYILLANL